MKQLGDYLPAPQDGSLAIEPGACLWLALPSPGRALGNRGCPCRLGSGPVGPLRPLTSALRIRHGAPAAPPLRPLVPFTAITPFLGGTEVPDILSFSVCVSLYKANVPEGSLLSLEFDPQAI